MKVQNGTGVYFQEFHTLDALYLGALEARSLLMRSYVRHRVQRKAAFVSHRTATIPKSVSCRQSAQMTCKGSKVEAQYMHLYLVVSTDGRPEGRFRDACWGRRSSRLTSRKLAEVS